MYILHSPSWFPDEHNPYSGNFIEKHVSAIALRYRCITLRVVPNERPIKKIEFIACIYLTVMALLFVDLWRVSRE
jgi:hypothetical protein